MRSFRADALNEFNRVCCARSTYTIPDGIRLLEGAKVLFPANVGPRLFAPHDKKQIITAGSSVTMREAEAMRFVARATHIPVQ